MTGSSLHDRPPAERGEKRRSLEEVILRLCAQDASHRSVDPIEAARAFAETRGEDALAWRHWLAHVRTAAIGLARQGRVVIYRKGKPADPDDFRGVYRIGLPRGD